ncbi:uncharacterized protein DUF4365 [Mycolicibacterium mucogenicum 261Sha1.1M5]|nr:uncharacterized protein DUF4365 [Mycolicibacterium mucogenicum 261Sha1.1M5]
MLAIETRAGGRLRRSAEERRKLQDENQVKGRYGEMLAVFAFPPEWVVRPIPDDFGLDLELEVFHEVDSRPNGVRRYQTRGEHLYMQVKTTDSLKTTKLERKRPATCLEVASFQMKTADLMLVESMGASVPVVLLLVDRTSNRIFYVCLTDYVSHYLESATPNWRERSRVEIYLPLRNELKPSGDPADLAAHWSYFSRLAGRGKLYSAFNLIYFYLNELKYKEPVLSGHFEADRRALLDYTQTYAEYLAKIRVLDVWPTSDEVAWNLLHDAVERLESLDAWCHGFRDMLQSLSPDDQLSMERIHWEPIHYLGVFETLAAISRTFHQVARFERLPASDPFNEDDLVSSAPSVDGNVV